MDLSSTHLKNCTADCDQAKLMVSGLIRLDGDGDQPMVVRRGMSIWTSDGQEAGKVAALVADHDREQAAHILLSRLPEVLGYLCIPVDLIKKVEDESVFLLIPSQEINNLPAWCSNL